MSDSTFAACGKPECPTCSGGQHRLHFVIPLTRVGCIVLGCYGSRQTRIGGTDRTHFSRRRNQDRTRSPRVVKLIQPPNPPHSFAQAVIATDARYGLETPLARPPHRPINSWVSCGEQQPTLSRAYGQPAGSLPCWLTLVYRRLAPLSPGGICLTLWNTK